jgi:outer membrane protein OmpA-like peptidoglycan-associated protein
MLMMGFFVILWVLKPPAGKDGEPTPTMPVEVRGEIKKAFNYVPDPNSNDPVDLYLRGLYKVKPHAETDGGKSTQEKEGKRGSEPDVESIRPSKQVGQGGKVLFVPGDAALSPAALKGLDDVVPLIKGHTNIFIVKGHASTDDYPEDGGTDAARMALSLARAQAAVEHLVAHGVARETLRVQGCGTFEPVVQRAYAPADRALNRRVEVYATGTLVQELQDGPKVTPAVGAEKAEH